MDQEQERRAKAIIAKHLAMNETTLEHLRQAGLKPDSVVQLDFVFVAPDRKHAEALQKRLEHNDCPEVSVEGQPGGVFLLTGKSQPTTVDLEILRNWVMWMVVQGVVESCEFDGWGTEVPSPEA